MELVIVQDLFLKETAGFAHVFPTTETTNRRHPLVLTTGRILSQYNGGAQTRRTENQTWHPEDILEIHPADALLRGIATGDMVSLSSWVETTTLRAVVSDPIPAGVVYTTFHHRSSALAASSAWLTPGNLRRFLCACQGRAKGIQAPRGCGYSILSACRSGRGASAALPSQRSPARADLLQRCPARGALRLSSSRISRCAAVSADEIALHEAVIRMGHDIARQFAHRDHDAAVEEVSAHILKFWEPRMRAELRRCVDAGDHDIEPILAEAVRTHAHEDDTQADRHDPSGG